MNKIKELRKEKGITQEELANMLHLKRSVISKYENGNIPLTDGLIIELSRLFNVTSDYILGNSIDRNPKMNGDKKNFQTLEEFLAQQGITGRENVIALKRIMEAMASSENSDENGDEVAAGGRKMRQIS